MTTSWVFPLEGLTDSQLPPLLVVADTVTDTGAAPDALEIVTVCVAGLAPPACPLNTSELLSTVTLPPPPPVPVVLTLSATFTVWFTPATLKVTVPV